VRSREHFHKLVICNTSGNPGDWPKSKPHPLKVHKIKNSFQNFWGVLVEFKVIKVDGSENKYQPETIQLCDVSAFL
jgi:hypothetical protein